MNDLSVIEAIYIHIPFCQQKCHYCDFLSFGGQTEVQKEEYINCLCKEMDLITARNRIYPRTIFIGGGTPTSLSDHLLQQLLDKINACFLHDSLEEYTIEANPGTLHEQQLYMMRQAGVNRLSLGVQSIHNEELKLLGRIHDEKQVHDTIQLAKYVGFDNINCDLMYGLPGQTKEKWVQTLERVLSWNLTHLSLYQLKIEEDTVFDQWLEQKKIVQYDQEQALVLYQTSKEILLQAGYHQYEISNYSKNGYQSKHNQVYWRTANYLGIGLGAHSFIAPNRYIQPLQWESYCKPLQQGILPQQELEQLSILEQMQETMFMGLRMNCGVILDEFYQRYQQKATIVFETAIETCKKNSWITVDREKICFTEQGRVLGNLVFMEFV